ncbi:uncharacterized protein LOC120264418 [Dioscorea cayenensis subsp. rotundata]|uniref:Uncharacterized protein LOC120264418 n=1 Tax=Dioscorea cayennensis subsp. rotundata TaxID=55577 RepID=A0AB40BL93_DIOCR|nr:uncharacterized protein LOC120264418 [Dioscorea cayenensis subsp. rotundata]XP_039128165.1 uncharacterized protein LOC120264418 [Dioscorea cayenensis subsp. rotundata]
MLALLGSSTSGIPCSILLGLWLKREQHNVWRCSREMSLHVGDGSSQELSEVREVILVVGHAHVHRSSVRIVSLRKRTKGTGDWGVFFYFHSLVGAVIWILGSLWTFRCCACFAGLANLAVDLIIIPIKVIRWSISPRPCMEVPVDT